MIAQDHLGIERLEQQPVLLGLPLILFNFLPPSRDFTIGRVLRASPHFFGV